MSGKTEHGFQIASCRRQARRSENYPLDEVKHPDPHGIEHEDCPGSFGEPFRDSPHSLRDRHRSVQDAPEDIGPVRPVPEAGEEPNDKQVQNYPAGFDSRSAQREIYVVPEPGGERDMPSAPEFGQVIRDIGEVKVLQEVESKHASQTDRHIRVTVEIKIQLESVAERSHPRHADGIISGGEGHIRHFGKHIGQKNLFVEAEKKAHDSLLEVIRRNMTLIDLVHDRGITDDRAGDQLGKQRDIESEIGRVLLCVNPPVYVHNIAERLKRKE